MLVCNAYIWAFLRAYICAFVRKNVRIRGKKTHVYRVAGMIASKRGKKPHVYRVIILKQMADHSLVVSRLLGNDAGVSSMLFADFL